MPSIKSHASRSSSSYSPAPLLLRMAGQTPALAKPSSSISFTVAVLRSLCRNSIAKRDCMITIMVA
eukprot:1383238-Rhodomonas_salina.1